MRAIRLTFKSDRLAVKKALLLRLAVSSKYKGWETNIPGKYSKLHPGDKDPNYIWKSQRQYRDVGGDGVPEYGGLRT